MRPFTHTIPFADARRIVLEAVVPIARTETIPLSLSDGRVVAADVRATQDVPPFDRAAMDGYAVVAADTAGATPDAPRSLACVGRVFAGEGLPRALSRGECAEIATGAPIPAGADAVVMVEETARDGDRIHIRAVVSVMQNVGRRGADMPAGQFAARGGDVLTPSRVGALAATGATTVTVFARPSVAVLSTGDELVDPGHSLAGGQIYEINRMTLAAVVNRHGGNAAPQPLAGDRLDDLESALDRALAHDIVVCSGGSSVGDRDLMLDVLRGRGTVHFHGIAVKPGKPTGFAHVGGTPVFAMPGYPTSCLSNAYMLLLPFLRATSRLPPWRPHTIAVPLARRIASVAGRHQFYTVRIVDGHAEPAFKASGDITSMAQADGYIEIEAGVDGVDKDSVVTVTLFN